MPAQAIEPFVDGSDRLNNPSLSSGVAIGVTDMNGDGLDDIVRLDDAESVEIEWQQPDGSFVHYVFGQLPGSQWGMALGDMNDDGITDIFAGGAYNGLKILRGNEAGDAYELTLMEQPGVFTQCVNFADIDNNGTLDLFVCHDDGLSAPLNNDGDGNYTYDLGLINAESTVPSDDSGNYGSVWTDYDGDGDLDLYIAKCRLFVNDPMDGRRLNLLFQNDGNGNYTDVAEAAGLRPGAQSWSMDFADVDNDGDRDAFLVNHDMLSQLYENLGDGTFADVTMGSGMTGDLMDLGQGIQSIFEDFDNDGWIDLLVTGRDGEHRLFMNNGGDLTFTAAVDPFPTGGLGIQSAAIGDLDSDGSPDIVAGFATGYNNPSNANPDRVFLNAGNDNNWLDVRLTGVESNASAAGATIEITGEWGTQLREVRAGEGYGITNSFIQHFGLGAAETIDTVTVYWPSGHVDTSENPDVLNERVHIIEGCPDMFYPDTDGDGYGDPTAGMNACLRPQGYVEDDSDCDDTNADINPDAEEICDGLDNNCVDGIDEGFDEPCFGGSSGGEESTGDVPPPADGSGTGVDPTNGDGSTGGDDAGAADGGDGGCACVASGDRGGMGFSSLMFGLVLGLRRLRRRG